MPDLGGAISAVTTIGGAVIGSKSSSKAAKAQEKAAAESAAIQREQIAQNEQFFNTIRGDMEPWRESGYDANDRLSYAMGFMDKPDNTLTWEQYKAQDEGGDGTAWQRYKAYRDASREDKRTYRRAKKDPAFGELTRDFTLSDFVKDPGYNFRLSEGLKGIDRLAASRGGYDSGTTLKALSRFNQDYASGEYGNAWQRDALEKNRRYGYLSNISGAGQNAAAQTGTFGPNIMGMNNNLANNIADIGLQVGNVNAANSINQGNIRNQVLGNIGSWAQNYFDQRNPPISINGDERGFGIGNWLPGKVYGG